MASGVKTRIKLPKTAALGEVITIKSMITHRMESGHRLDETGQPIPRSIINRFVCEFEGETVVDVEMNPSISNNPFFEFQARVPASGVFSFTWYDDDGAIYTAQETIQIA